MRIFGSLAMLLLAAPLAAATPATQAPTRAKIINHKSPGSEGGAAGGGCDIARCPQICEFYYGPFGGMSMCYGKPKQCNHIDEASHLAYCTCEYGHDMPPKW